MNAPVITTICVPPGDELIEGIVLRSLRQTTEVLEHCRRVAAVDVATPIVRECLAMRNWEIVELAAGAPPRMSALLAEAVALVRGDAPFVLTVEHDTLIQPGALELLGAALERCPHAAGIEALSVDPDGRPIRPCIAYRQVDAPGQVDLAECPDGIGFNTTLWRMAALDAVDWSRLPAWQKADTALCRQAAVAGWSTYLHRRARTVHLRANVGPAMRAWRESLEWRA